MPNMFESSAHCRRQLPRVADHLDAARPDLLAFNLFPKQIWKQICPDRTAVILLVGTVLAEQHDEWIEWRCYLGLDVLARSSNDRPTDRTTESHESTEEVTLALTA